MLSLYLVSVFTKLIRRSCHWRFIQEYYRIPHFVRGPVSFTITTLSIHIM